LDGLLHIHRLRGGVVGLLRVPILLRSILLLWWGILLLLWGVLLLLRGVLLRVLLRWVLRLCGRGLEIGILGFRGLRGERRCLRSRISRVVGRIHLQNLANNR
jgi:hypothetical protein